MSTLTKAIKLVAVSISASFIIANSSLMAAQTINKHMIDDWPDSRYIVHDDGTVTDSKTKLMWKVCIERETWSSSDGKPACTTSGDAMFWKDALERVNNLSFAGYRDWRVPNRNELLSLVARNRATPAINATIFPNVRIINHWTSSPVSGSNNLWTVDYMFGFDGRRFSKLRNYGVLRLVRSSQ